MHTRHQTQQESCLFLFAMRRLPALRSPPRRASRCRGCLARLLACLDGPRAKPRSSGRAPSAVERQRSENAQIAKSSSQGVPLPMVLESGTRKRLLLSATYEPWTFPARRAALRAERMLYMGTTCGNMFPRRASRRCTTAFWRYAAPKISAVSGRRPLGTVGLQFRP